MRLVAGGDGSAATEGGEHPLAGQFRKQIFLLQNDNDGLNFPKEGGVEDRVGSVL